jgi:hypothetical protein
VLVPPLSLPLASQSVQRFLLQKKKFQNTARKLTRIVTQSPSTSELRPIYGIWLQFNALPSDTATATLVATLPLVAPDEPNVEPLSVHWEENATWVSFNASRSQFARPLGELRFDAGVRSANLSLGAVLPVLRRAFTLRVELSPNAFFAADQFRVASFALVVDSAPSAVAALAAACAGGAPTSSCDACLARGGELCGFCAETASCQFGWRDGPIATSCSRMWQYAACPSADRDVLAPVEECIAGATYRYRFALPATVGTRGLASASLQLASLASPFVVDPQVVFTTFDIAYVRSTAAVGSLEQPLCDLVLDTAERREIGTLAHGQRFVGDVADGVRHLATLGERTLIVEASATSDDNVFEIVVGGDVSHTRDTPRLTLNWLAGDAPAPPSSTCAGATSCAACTELPFCGWCGNRCVQGDLNAPSNATCAEYSFDAGLCSASERLTLSASVAPTATCLASTSLGETRHVDSDLERFVQLSYDFKSIVLSFDLRPVRAAMLANRSRVATGSVQLRARYRDTELPAEPVYADLTWLVGASALCSNASSAAAYSAVVDAPAAVHLAANASVQPRDVPVTTLPIAANALASALYADTLQVRLTFVDAGVRVWSPVAINVNERLAPTLVVEFAAAATQPDPCAALATHAACLTAPSCGWCSRVASRGGAAGCISGSPLTPHNASECAPTNYSFAEPATVGAAGVTVEMHVVDDVAYWGNPWPNMPSLASSAVEAVVRVPASLASRRVARATLAFRFVRGALREGDVEYTDESVAAATRNDSVTATVRFDRAARFDAPLALTMLGANDGFAIDVTDALRVAAESAARLFVVRIGGNVSQSALDVRVFSSFDPNPRRAAALGVVTVADATEAANAACVVHTTCGACSAVESCGWCVGASDAGACVAGSHQQPLFGRTCAAWSYSACLPSDMVALFTPLACSNVGRVVDDRAPIAALYEPQDTPRAAAQPRSQLQMTHVQVVTIDLTALRVGGHGALSVQAPIRLRLFAAQHADLSALPPTDVVAWILPSTDSLNVSAADCAALGPLTFDSGDAVARTRLASQIHAGDAIDLDVTAALANATTADQLVRIMFSTQATALAIVAPGNCARPRFRPMLVTRTPQLTRGAVAQRRTIADDCPFDGGLYSDAAALPDAPLGRRDIAVGAAQQWRTGDASASAAQALGDVSDALRDTLPRVVDITSLAFVGANATLVAFVGAPTLGRFDLVRVSDSLNVSTPIRLVLVVDADSTPTGNATITLVRAASLRGTAPTVVVDPFVVGSDAQCIDVTATAQVNANATLSARLAVGHFPRARVADMQRVSVRDSGDEFVVLRGVGFVAPAPDPRPSAAGGAIKCLFQSGQPFVANATVLNDTAISCGPLPPIDIALVRSGVIALSWDGGVCATATMAAFDVASDCTKACSGHGQCRLQECVCVDPFRGDNCERVVQALQVAPVPNATIDDGQFYSVPINVVNGSAPIVSVAFALPDGAVWNAQNRTLVWSRPVGRMRPYEMVVRVSNELDSVTLSWFVTVRRTIAVGINVTQDERRLPLPVGERIDLHVQTIPVTAGVVASIMAQSPGTDAWFEFGAGENGTTVAFVPTAEQVGINCVCCNEAW